MFLEEFPDDSLWGVREQGGVGASPSGAGLWPWAGAAGLGAVAGGGRPRGGAGGEFDVESGAGGHDVTPKTLTGGD